MSALKYPAQTVEDLPPPALNGQVATVIESTRTVDGAITHLGQLPPQTTGSMALGQSLASAVEALKTNRVRSVLTMLGIIIGVGAVIVMVGLGAGSQASVSQRLAGLGTNLLTIRPGSSSQGGVRSGGGTQQTLTIPDVQAVQQQVSGIAAITPIDSAGSVQVVAGNQNWSTSVQGSYPAIFTIQSYQIAMGQAYVQSDESSGALVADIGQTVATNVFGTSNPVGQTILIRGVAFTVDGLLASKGSNGFQDQDDIILIPFSTGQVRLFGVTTVNTIDVQVASSSQISNVQSQIETLLRAQHHLTGSTQDDFTVQSNQQIINTVQSTTSTLTTLLIGVAAVSLLVGGIGIMNIMLVSVTERTREIGIRMAIGAQPANILSQFLIEAVLLSVAGGIVGILIGVGSSIGASRFLGASMLVTPGAIALSFGFAAFVGIFFGYYPARKAARLHPIEALRYE